MKKKILTLTAIVVVLALTYFIGSGFRKISSACINGYSVSEDGKEIALNIGVISSAGFVRKAAVHQQEDGKLYIDCYSAFGGINGRIGAKTTYTVPLADDTTIIALYRDTGCYEEVLKKDAAGVWQRIK